MIILFQNILFLKEFLAYSCSFGLFTKIKMGSGTSFWCTFSAWFFDKIFSLCNNLSMDKLSMSYLFSFPRYQIKCVIKLSLRQLMTSSTLRFIFKQPLKQWQKRRKKGEDESTIIWISWEWKEFFKWNKNHFL